MLTNNEGENQIKQVEEFIKTWIDGLKASGEQAEKDYFNPGNYPLYQRSYYSLSRLIDGLSSLEEYDKFHKQVTDCFGSMFAIYKNTNLDGLEKGLSFYKENMAFHFIDCHNKLLRSIGKFYKKK